MQLPEWTKPALTGAGVGAFALAMVGFSWGGWMTSGSVAKLSDKQSMAAVATALTPYCVQKSNRDPMAAEVLVKLEEASSYQRRGIVEKAGWATPLGSEEPDRALAESCQIALIQDM